MPCGGWPLRGNRRLLVSRRLLIAVRTPRISLIPTSRFCLGRRVGSPIVPLVPRWCRLGGRRGKLGPSVPGGAADTALTTVPFACSLPSRNCRTRRWAGGSMAPHHVCPSAVHCARSAALSVSSSADGVSGTSIPVMAGLVQSAGSVSGSSGHTQNRADRSSPGASWDPHSSCCCAANVSSIFDRAKSASDVPHLNRLAPLSWQAADIRACIARLRSVARSRRELYSLQPPAVGDRSRSIHTVVALWLPHSLR